MTGARLSSTLQLEMSCWWPWRLVCRWLAGCSSGHSSAQSILGSVPCSLSLGPYHTTDMLKHKLRKSRKNILHLLDYAQDQDEEAQIPEYSEIKKPGRKEKSKKKGIWIFKSIFSALSIINNSCLGKQQFARRWDGGGPETAPRQIFRTFEN